MSEQVTNEQVTPYLTLEMICGDAHAGLGIKRCLTSVLRRSSGEPLVDAIGITFNGSGDGLRQLAATLVGLGFTVPGNLEIPDITLYGPVPLTLRQRKWPGRFDLARNDGWRHARGEWVMWLDGDDEIADAGTHEGLKAIERVERDYGLRPAPASSSSAPASSLKTLLQQLPHQINAVFCPYDYTIDENNYVHVRQKMKRIVRRSACHIWHSPEQSGIHESLTPIGWVREQMAETFGVLVQHHPTQGQAERVTRNVKIVGEMSRPGILSDPRHAFDVANAALAAGHMEGADSAICAAIQNATNEMDRYTFQLARAYLGGQQNDAQKMLHEALNAIGTLPNLRDAYFMATEAFYRLCKWESVVEFYERGAAKKPTLLALDQPLAIFTAPRAQAALSHFHLGNNDKAMALVLEMESTYPKSGLTVEAGTKIRSLIARRTGESSLYQSLELLLDIAPRSAVQFAELVRGTPVLATTRQSLRWKELEFKARNVPVGADRFSTLSNPDGSVVLKLFDGGMLTVDDVLQGTDAKSQLVEAELSPDSRQAKAVFRKRSCTKPKRIAFYAPTGWKPWEPSDLMDGGMGGSESSVAHLAVELAALGHDVTTFTCKLRQPEVARMWRGVVQKDCAMYVPSEWKDDDIVVFCRAPWMAQQDPPSTSNIFCWHQDNGYGNPWLWNETVVAAQKHLFVSEFAKGTLLNDARAETCRGGILGNGVTPDCLNDWPNERAPFSVLYASNPSRGLEQLLNLWPEVLKAIPEAQLTVACEWVVMLGTTQDEPGVKAGDRIQALQDRLKTAPNVTNIGWLPQHHLLKLMKSTQLYVYPGGPMPEGFGVALVQAAACGCDVVFPNAGALPSVLVPFTPSDVIDADLIVRRLRNPLDDEARPTLAAGALERHSWPTVAKRFLELVQT